MLLLALSLLCAGAGPAGADAVGSTRRPPAEVETAGETELPSFEGARYFADGPFAPAQRALVRGETREAVQQLRRLLKSYPESTEAPQARYLLGLALIQLGEYDEAVHLFDELVVTYPALKDEHLYSKGQALYLWGSYLEAAEVLAKVDPNGPRFAEAQRLRAWALLRATDFERLVRWLEEVERAGHLEPELLFVLGRARHRTGDVLGAARAFREVWRDAGKLAGAALVQMAELKIGDKPMLGEAERAAVRALQAKLTATDDPERSLAELDRRLTGGDTARLRAELSYVRGRVAQSHGRLMTAEAHLMRALELAPVELGELRARAGVELGGVLERLGAEQKALAAYRTVAERFPERAESEDARFFAAEILLGGRKYKEAQAELEALLLKNPVTPRRPRALWGIGWAHFRLGNYQRASQFFAPLVKMGLSADLDAASTYWYARSEASLGHAEEARRHYARVLERHPLSHYAAFAEDQLLVVSEDAVKGASPAVVAGAAAPKELSELQEYLRLGLKERALALLRALEARQRKGKAAAEPLLRAMARAYDELGQNAEARRLREECAREHPRSLGDADFVELAKRAHPLKFEELIRPAADEFGIPDSLLFGLIRTESGFRADAVSNMSAYGLAQLILPTAQTVARDIGAGRASKARLLGDTHFNVRLGAAYLRQLLDRYDGSEPLALAAYNAGPAAVDAWLEQRVRKLEGVEAGRGVGLMPAPDELAEEIPVAETRGFVKTVLARARSYARLYPRPKREALPTSPEVEEGAILEPADLVRALPAPEPVGARVVEEEARGDERERILYGALR